MFTIKKHVVGDGKNVIGDGATHFIKIICYAQFIVNEYFEKGDVHHETRNNPKEYRGFTFVVY